MDVYLLGGPFWQAALVQVADAVGVGLHRFFFQVAHKGVTQLGGHHICQKVGIEEDALQERVKRSLSKLIGIEENALQQRGQHILLVLQCTIQWSWRAHIPCSKAPEEEK